MPDVINPQDAAASCEPLRPHVGAEDTVLFHAPASGTLDATALSSSPAPMPCAKQIERPRRRRPYVQRERVRHQPQCRSSELPGNATSLRAASRWNSAPANLLRYP